MRLTGRGEFSTGAFGPGAGAEELEGVRGGAQLLAGEDPVPGPAQPFSVRQPGARLLERIGGLLVQAQRLLEVRGKACVVGQQPLAACRTGQRPWLALGRRGRGELRGDLLRLAAAAEPDVGVGEFRGGGEVRVGDRQVTQ